MNRDDLILDCQDIVKNLVRKYNNHRLDEDLISIGMIAVVECVDQSLAEGIENINQIKARCNIWVRNVILKQIYSEKIKYVDDDTAIDTAEAPEDLWETVACVKTTLGPRASEVFDLLLRGKSQSEIMTILGISKGTCENHLSHIRQKIKNLIVKNDEV